MRSWPLALALFPVIACGPPRDNASRTVGPDPGVVCAGASLEEASAKSHPALLRGTVKAPQLQASGVSWIRAAHAYALDFETPVPDARVWLVDAQGRELMSTRTGPRGRWCLRVPRGHKLAPRMMLHAQRDGLRLRHIAAYPFDTEISSMSEALVRALERAKVSRAAISSEQFLNLRTLADTAVGLMSGMDTKKARGSDALITEMLGVIEGDARVQASLAKLSREPLGKGEKK